MVWRETIWEQPLAAGSQACPLPRRVSQSCTHGVDFAQNRSCWGGFWRRNETRFVCTLEQSFKCHPHTHRWHLIHVSNVCRCRDVDNVEEHSEGQKWHMQTIVSQFAPNLFWSVFETVRIYDLSDNHKLVQVSLRQIAIKLAKRHLSIRLIFDFGVQVFKRWTQQDVILICITNAGKLELLWHAPWALPGSSKSENEITSFCSLRMWCDSALLCFDPVKIKRFRLTPSRLAVINTNRATSADASFVSHGSGHIFPLAATQLCFVVVVWKNCDQYGIAVMVVVLLLIGPSELRAAACIPALTTSNLQCTPGSTRVPSRFITTYMGDGYQKKYFWDKQFC